MNFEEISEKLQHTQELRVNKAAMGHYSETNIAFAHPLRKVILIAFIPGLALCTAASVVTYNPVPGLGLIPHGGSALLSIITLAIARHARKKREGTHPEVGGDGDDDDDSRPPFLLSPVAIFLYDLVLAMLLLTVLIFSWITIRGYLALLSSYATIPLLVAL